MKKVRSFISVMLSLLAIFSSCHKDEQIPLQPYPRDCPSNGFDTMPQGVFYTDPIIYADSLNIEFPYFNPNNANEIIYYLGYKRELIKYNIITKDKKKLYKGQLFNRAKWSRKRWILLPTSDGQIWKIKDDGTQLTQLTFGPIGHYSPEWNLEGTKFGCYADNKYGGMMYDEFGVALDSFKHPLTGCWQGKDTNIVLGAGGNTIGYTDLYLDSFIKLFLWPQNYENEFYDSYWMQDGINAIVVANNGIYAFNMQTKKLTFLKQSCPHDSYRSLSISQSGKILLQKSSWHYVGANRIFIQTSLVLMNTDGSGEVEIEL